jgi:hypothetical protein
VGKVWVRLFVGIVVTGLMAAVVGSIPVQAKGADLCPEPNDQFQQACALEPGKEATGYLFHAGDYDAYRIVALDFRAGIRLELLDAPHPYQIELTDWNGRAIASSTERVLDATVSQPGTYYAFVWSPGGGSSDDLPYRLAARLTYPSGVTPQVLVSNDFGGVADRQEDTRWATYVWTAGRLTVTAKEVPAVYVTPDWLKVKNLRNFTWTFDARLVNKTTRTGFLANARYAWRGLNSSQVSLYVGAQTSEVTLAKKQSISSVAESTVWSPTVDKTGGVNRTTIHAVEENVTVYINGQEVVRVVDDDVLPGEISVSLIGHDQPPPSFNFDNFLITTPAQP